MGDELVLSGGEEGLTAQSGLRVRLTLDMLAGIAVYCPQGASMTAQETCCTGGQRLPTAAFCARLNALFVSMTTSLFTTRG